MHVALIRFLFSDSWDVCVCVCVCVQTSCLYSTDRKNGFVTEIVARGFFTADATL